MKKYLNKKSLLKTLSLYTLVFVLMQAWAAVLFMLNPITELTNVNALSKKAFQSWPVISGVLHFLFSQLLVYILFTILLWMVTVLISKLFSLSNKAEIRTGITLWIISIITIFLANQYLFPWSVFSFLPKNNFADILTIIGLILGGLILLIASILACISLIKLILNSAFGYYKLTGLILIIIAVSIFIFMPSQEIAIQNSNQPNIIIIGVDSLRYDITNNNAKYRTLIPNIFNFTKGAAIFTNAYTPLARTFPSWMSILTGNFPKNSGARYSLPRISSLNLSQTVANILRKHGYETIYASDDRRFNHITKAFGFDQVIAPETGLNDFLLGTLNDFPLSNLLINTTLGKWLFPYSYANRSAAVTYEPKTFVEFLAHGLAKVHKRPVFLAMHLTLPHWPFYWANAPLVTSKFTAHQGFSYELYVHSIHAADKQFGSVIQLLKQNKLLNNSLVFVVSDHGQGLREPGELVINKNKYFPGNKPLSKTELKAVLASDPGHGTDILNFSQNHIFFAIKSFNLKRKIITKKYTSPVMLIDIKPTILNFLNLTAVNTTGKSLWPLITGKISYLNTRDFFMETGFTLPGLLVAQPNISNLISEGLSYFTVDTQTGAIIINEDLGKVIIRGKQRAIIRYPWMLAIYPISKQDKILLLVNIQTNAWTTDLNSQLAKTADAKELMIKLKKFYGAELNNLKVNS